MDKDTLNKRIIKKLIGSIAGGEYQDGQALPAERKLAQQLGVSRGSLRAALGELKNIGLVDIRAGSGVYVRNIAMRDLPQSLLPADVHSISVADIMVARKAIELAAIEKAVETMTASQIGNLEKIVAGMAESILNLPQYIKLDMEFHEFIVKSAGNPVLWAAYSAINEYHRYIHVITTQNEQCEELSYNYHCKILESVKKRDAAKAKLLLSAHLDNVVDLMKN